MIELKSVVKTYGHDLRPGHKPVRALDGVSLSIQPGTALGVVGLNGAGKSTLLRVLLGYIRPSAGEVTIDGRGPRQYIQANGAAYVPERVAIPRGWTVEGALRAYAMLGELGRDAWDRVGSALDRLGLRPLAERKVATLSKGNLQRLALAQALLADRKLMVLDEPTDGLDPVWIVELRQLIQRWLAADPERILILASHNLPEVERLTNRVILLHNGTVAGELHTNDDPLSLEAAFLTEIAKLQEPRP